MSVAHTRKFLDRFNLTIGIFVGVAAAVVFLLFLTRPSIGTDIYRTLISSIIGMLIVLGLWTLAWRRQPFLAFGIFLGTASVCVLAALVRPMSPQHLPIWLPPLPIAVVALSLFYFGTLAWLWGRKERS